MEFFKEREVDDRTLQKVAAILIYERFHTNSMVFDKGQIGDKLYIVLGGTVSV